MRRNHLQIPSVGGSVRGARRARTMSDERRLKHLKFVQGVINRLSTNSSLLKGWSVILVSALFALSAADSRLEFAYLAFMPAFVFWGLDGFFLWHERLYRRLYDQVRQQEEVYLDLSMDINPFKKNGPTWLGAIFSKTLILFYGVLIIAVALVMCVT